MQNKIKNFQEVTLLLNKARQNGKRIVLCHGVFDLLHPGHIRHFQEAKKQGELLVVTLTPDRYVNKGPGRPAFSEKLRLESLASIGLIDYVVLNDTSDAVSCIQKIQPDVYVKGKEYKDHSSDVTKKIQEESDAVESSGGSVYYTDDLVFSSSSLLNRHFENFQPQQKSFLEFIRQSYTVEGLLKKIDSFAQLRVLVVGDAIIDQYQYVDPLGKSGKGLHMSSVCLDEETFIGGALIIANHVAGFAGKVTLISAVGQNCSNENLIRKKLHPQVQAKFVRSNVDQTLTKKRYVLKENNRLSKLFETYSSNQELLQEDQTDEVIESIKAHASEVDLVLVCDFGNGFTNQKIRHALSRVPAFLAVNTQINSGNRGFNVITQYERADFISLNEPEIRLATHNQKLPLEALAATISQKMNCPHISVTCGSEGALCYDRERGSHSVPPFAQYVIDRVGAGDSYLSIASLCLSAGLPIQLAGFLGSVAAAMDVQFVGNEKSIEKIPFCKFLTRLLK